VMLFGKPVYLLKIYGINLTLLTKTQPQQPHPEGQRLRRLRPTLMLCLTSTNSHGNN